MTNREMSDDLQMISRRYLAMATKEEPDGALVSGTLMALSAVLMGGTEYKIKWAELMSSFASDMLKEIEPKGEQCPLKNMRKGV